MGLLTRKRKDGSFREAGSLLALEAIDQTGLMVTREGAFVRAIHVSPPNPLIMSEEDRRETAAAFGYLVGRLSPGQSLQFYVEARPVVLEEVLADAREQVASVAGEVPTASNPPPDERSRALWRLYAGMEESLAIHSDDQAAVKVDVYVIVPYLPDQQVTRIGRHNLHIGRRRLKTAPLKRGVQAHRRSARESLQHTEVIRSELDGLDLPTKLLDGEEVAALLWGRFNPTLADKGDALPAGRSVEVVGELDAGRDQEEAREAAKRLRELIPQSAIDFKSDWRMGRVGGDLEQTVYAATTADATSFGWLIGAMQARQPYTLTVHVHALDRLRERQRQKMSYRRTFGINRASEMSGQVPDFDRLAQEQEKGELLAEMAGAERTCLYEVSIYQAIRERGPEPDKAELAMAVDYVVEQIASASDIRVHRGEWQQRELWESTLPLGRDVASRVRKYATRNVGDTVPVVGTSCGSPRGIPLGFAEPGRTIERLDPYDRTHDNFTLLINGKGGAGKTLAANVILMRCLAYGARAFVLDRAGHYRILTELVHGGQHISIGSDEGDYAVNPWDTDDPAAVSLEKIAFLVSLHALLVGGHDGDALGVTAIERNMLEGAIRAVYRRAASEGFAPRESDLRDELRTRADAELSEGAKDMAAGLRSLAERIESFCGEGSYAYLLDRPTTVPEDAPIVVFDTRRVPEAVLGPVVFALAEYVTRQIERHRRESAELGGDGWQMFRGRSVFLIDEGWHLVKRRATGEWANDLARRARHMGLFLIVISQQLSDFANEYGRALIRNSTMQLFLRQAPEELGYVKDALRLSDAEIGIVSRLKTLKGSFSQAYFVNGVRGRGAISIRVGPTEYWIATSDPVRDVPLRDSALKESGGDVWAAVASLAEGAALGAESHQGASKG